MGSYLCFLNLQVILIVLSSKSVQWNWIEKKKNKEEEYSREGKRKEKVATSLELMGSSN